MSNSHHAFNEVRVFPQKRYKERRHWLDSIKISSGCLDCKHSGPAETLTFDHVRGDKKFGVGSSWNQGRIALEEEIAKCEIVCTNCHAIRTKNRLRADLKDLPEFVPFPKVPRLRRNATVSEKIDGTHGLVWVDGEGDVWAGSRNRWLTPTDDNMGFAKWVAEHEEEFSDLGPCVLHGEWMGKGIQRGYGLDHRRFYLFNTHRWKEETPPACCHVVPVLGEGTFSDLLLEQALEKLRNEGSVAAPGFMRPEGIVTFLSASGSLYKTLLENDDEPKGHGNV